MSGTNYIASNWRVPENSNSSKNDNYSLSFDGSTNYIDCGNISALGGLTQATWAGWFKRDLNSGTDNLMSIWGTGFTTRQFRAVTEPNRLYVRMGNSIGAERSMFDSTSVTFTAGVWYHFVFVYNEAEADDADKMKVYVDGVPQTNEVAGAALTSLNPSIAPFTIGYLGGYGTNSFDGHISDVCIFDYALTQDQVNTLHGNGTSGSGSPMSLKPTPIAYYPLGDNSSGGIDVGPTSILTQPNVSVNDASVFDFDPSASNYINMGNPNELQITGELSISAWVKTTANDGVIVGKANTSGTERSYGLWSDRFGSNQTPVFFVWGSGTYYETPPTGPRVDDGNWHHLLATFKPSTYLRLYIDGQLEQENTTSIPASIDNDVVDFNIGRAANGTFLYDGEISNVVIWNSDQSSEKDNIYNDGIPATSYTNTPVAWYKLDQSANWEADTSGNWQIPDAVSAYPKSFNFVRKTSAVNGRAYLGSGSLTFNDKISASIWVRVDLSAANNYQLLFAQTDGTNNSWSIGLNSGNEIWYRIWNADGSLNQDTNFSGTDIKDGKWHHVVLVYDGTSNANGIKLFLDGEPEAQLTASSTGIDAQPLKIALANSSLPTQNSPAFNVGLANAQVWDTNLGDAEIEALYNNGTPLTTAIQSANLKGWWKLDDTALFDNTNWSIENQVNPSNYNSALDFDGGTDVVTVPAIDFDMTNDLTLSCWINLGAPSTWDYLCTRGGSGGTNSALNWRFSSGGALYSTYNGSSIAAGVGFTTGGTTWHHLAITFNYSNGDVLIYKDGVQTGNTLTFASGYPIARLQCIGAATNAGASSINAKISNFAIWESIQDISELYNNGTPATSYTNTPAAWWKLDNLTTGLQDNGSGGNNATNNGTTVANTFVNTESGTSADMTEQSLVNNNVSTLNGESSGMTSGNLVLSNLTRNLPYENYSINFDGLTEYVECGNVSALNGTTEATWAGWFKRGSTGTYYPLSTWDAASQNQFFFIQTSTYVIAACADSIGAQKNMARADITWVTGQWYHLAFVYNEAESSNADKMKIYIDGVLQTNVIAGNSLTSLHSSTAPFYIGKIGGFTTNEFNGNISNVAIWDTNLSSTEVQKLYANGVPQDLTNFTPQPINWWTLGKNSFWNGSNWIIRDVINSNDGTSANMGVDSLTGDAPRSEANGTGTNMDIPTNLVGNAGFSDKNAYSINMGPSARVTDTP